MSLLWGTCYDPATAVAKNTTAAQAMTAIDATNLRATFNAPANGIVLVHMACVASGATTFPQVLLGVMNHATPFAVLKRQAPLAGLSGTAVASTFQTMEALFVVTGLTPGAAQDWDAAYGVETAVAATAIRYGGPNGTGINDAWGGFVFECWSV